MTGFELALALKQENVLEPSRQLLSKHWHHPHLEEGSLKSLHTHTSDPA